MLTVETIGAQRDDEDLMRRKVEAAVDLLRISHNGRADIGAFLATEYGQEHLRRLRLGFTFEEDPTGPAIEAHYRELGLRRLVFENDDYYSRWVLIVPEESARAAADGARFPLVIAHHGGFASISDEEFLGGLPELAASERLMVAFLQDTNWRNTERVLDRVEELFPVDSERVYLMGESQGACQVRSALFRIPERFAGVVLCGHEVYYDWDNHNVPFTEAETARLTEAFVPVMHLNGQHEASSPAPVGDWRARKDWGRSALPAPYRDPRRDDRRDPTRVTTGRGRFSDKPIPPADVDRHDWMIGQLAKQLATVGCAPPDRDACRSYSSSPDSDLHATIGFAGDRERVEHLGGLTHWTADVLRPDGLVGLRYTVVENAPHCWPVTAGVVGWAFLEQFRRDSSTGRISAQLDHK